MAFPKRVVTEPMPPGDALAVARSLGLAGFVKEFLNLVHFLAVRIAERLCFGGGEFQFLQ